MRMPSKFSVDAYGTRVALEIIGTCPVNFEFLNYTIITSKCKGPNYPPDLCCGSFKEFACPYADVINDLTNDCASTMFSYINLYGKYPPGLFASECREGKEGLACPAQAPSVSANESGTHNMYPSPLLMLTAGFFLGRLVEMVVVVVVGRFAGGGLWEWVTVAVGSDCATEIWWWIRFGGSGYRI
ncbi:gpi-anchored protein llg1 [Quercus suber]|uniref:Gpi-anchored protein llg1 n=1 Tax=Quercus suber TaxID=58331 RepID=A0AAW0JQI4_QUESU